jgi:Ca2+-dependent lipid-binding protein
VQIKAQLAEQIYRAFNNGVKQPRESERSGEFEKKNDDEPQRGCVLKLGKEKRKSSTIKRNYNPKSWKEDFVFNITDEQQELVVTLCDWDHI